MMFFLPLPAPAQSFSKLRRQARIDDFILAATQVVFDAVKGYLPIAIIIDKERGTGIAIAWLSYAARIDEISSAWLQK